MTKLSLVPDTGSELPSQQVARKVRGIMGEYRISGRKMAGAMHMDQKAFSRRYSGEVAWSFNEMVEIADLLGVPLSELCAIRDSNPEPADLGETPFDLRLILETSPDESH